MAAGNFKFYHMAKEYLCDATIDLDGDTFDLHLFTSGSDFATATNSTLAGLSGEVASGNGYALAGRQLTPTWATGASASERRFDASDLVITASGGTIADIKGAVVVARTGASAEDPANKLLCYASLTSGQFSLTDTNTLTIQFAAGGLFELN